MKTSPLGIAIASAVGVGAVAVATAQVLAAPRNSAAPAPPPSFQVTTTASDIPTGGASLYPSAVGALYVKVTNTTGVAVTVTALSAGTITPTSCSVTVDPSAVDRWLASSPTVAGRSTSTFTIVGALRMGQAANACQGATISVPVTITAQQAS